MFEPERERSWLKDRLRDMTFSHNVMQGITTFTARLSTLFASLKLVVQDTELSELGQRQRRSSVNERNVGDIRMTGINLQGFHMIFTAESLHRFHNEVLKVYEKMQGQCDGGHSRRSVSSHNGDQSGSCCIQFVCVQNLVSHKMWSEFWSVQPLIMHGMLIILTDVSTNLTFYGIDKATTQPLVIISYWWTAHTEWR